jgi:hypothetical protein
MENNHRLFLILKINIFLIVSFHVMGPFAVDVPFVVRGCHFQQILFIPYLENFYKKKMYETFGPFRSIC